ncbi:unnamed protein product [Sphagnum jensenii]|uniref:Uncharacterized protein n=1 Tax=Sphagnum jensenii TaxID=128206 RepID=A0ABP1BJ82_9BRYO
MSVAYQRWELRAAGAPSVCRNKITGGGGASQQQQQQQQQAHELLPACNLSSFSSMSKQSMAAATVSSTALSLVPDHQETRAAAAEDQLQQRWGLSLVIKTKEAAAHVTKAAEMRSTCMRPTLVAATTDLKRSGGHDQQQCAVLVKKNEMVVAASFVASPSSSSSSICNGKEQSSCSSDDQEIAAASGDSMQEAQSAYRGPLHQMSALESSLPIKRPGLSKFFGGKSQSFSSLADVSSVSDLAKPNNPYAKRRRMMGPLVNASQTSLDRHRSYPPLSRTSVVSFSKKPASNRSTNTLTIALKLGSLREAAAAAEEQEDEEEEDYVHADLPAAAQGSSRIGGHMTRATPSRSFSLTDLPLVGLPPAPPPPSSSTPFQNSFAYHGP